MNIHLSLVKIPYLATLTYAPLGIIMSHIGKCWLTFASLCSSCIYTGGFSLSFHCLQRHKCHWVILKLLSSLRVVYEPYNAVFNQSSIQGSTSVHVCQGMVKMWPLGPKAPISVERGLYSDHLAPDFPRGDCSPFVAPFTTLNNGGHRVLVSRLCHTQRIGLCFGR